MFESGELRYEGVSFLFGDGTPYRLTNVVRGSADFRVDDVDRVRRDGRMFGRDFKSGPTHTISMLVEGSGASRDEREADTRVRLGLLAAAWSADSVRNRGGSLAALRIGERWAYGRPRTFAPDDSGIWDGVAEPVMEFVATDDLWYGSPVETVIRFAPAVGGGLRFPAQAPFRFGGQPSVRNASVVVGGEQAAWPVFEVRGPVVNPSVDVPGVGILTFNTALAFDERLVVDTRERWVKRGRVGGALFPAPGLLSPTGSRLSDMSLLPGAHSVVLRGTDSTNSAELRVTVAPAFSTL